MESSSEDDMAGMLSEYDSSPESEADSYGNESDEGSPPSKRIRPDSRPATQAAEFDPTTFDLPDEMQSTTIGEMRDHHTSPRLVSRQGRGGRRVAGGGRRRGRPQGIRRPTRTAGKRRSRVKPQRSGANRMARAAQCREAGGRWGKKPVITFDRGEAERIQARTNERNEHVKTILAGMREDQLREVLGKMAERHAGLLYTLLVYQNIGQLDEQDKQEQTSADTTQHTPQPTSPDQEHTAIIMTPKQPQSAPHVQLQLHTPHGSNTTTQHAHVGPASPEPSPPSPQRTTAGFPRWCSCNHCRQMPTPVEEKCCGLTPADCLANTLEFDQTCLEGIGLAMGRAARNDIHGLTHEGEQQEEGGENSAMRHQAYRNFILWQHGYLGARRRKVIPSCCIWKVRDKYPNAFGIYRGFVGIDEYD